MILRMLAPVCASIALAIALAPAAAASGASVSPLSQIQSISASEASTLQRAGVTTLAELASSDVRRIARLLRTDTERASKIVGDAKAESTRLQRVYSMERSRFRLATPVPGMRRSADSAADDYAALVAPNNECTILVRKACGSANQCADSPGCPVAKSLLERYNAGEVDAAESCVIALEDAIIFPQCM